MFGNRETLPLFTCNKLSRLGQSVNKFGMACMVPPDDPAHDVHCFKVIKYSYLASSSTIMPNQYPPFHPASEEPFVISLKE